MPLILARRVIFAFLGVLARKWLVACEAWSGAICDLPFRYLHAVERG